MNAACWLALRLLAHLPCTASSEWRQTELNRRRRTARTGCRRAVTACMAAHGHKTRSPGICIASSGHGSIHRCTTPGIGAQSSRPQTASCMSKTGIPYICTCRSESATRSRNKRVGSQRMPHHRPHLTSRQHHLQLQQKKQMIDECHLRRRELRTQHRRLRRDRTTHSHGICTTCNGQKLPSQHTSRSTPRGVRRPPALMCTP